jgi:cytochrome oxidase Cu insertion factor (SCO1/SenC/PrrC family)
LRTLLAAAVLLAAASAADPPRPRSGPIKVGDPAPAFDLVRLGSDKPVKLSDLKGKPVVLVFGSCT